MDISFKSLNLSNLVVEKSKDTLQSIQTLNLYISLVLNEHKLNLVPASTTINRLEKLIAKTEPKVINNFCQGDRINYIGILFFVLSKLLNVVDKHDTSKILKIINLLFNSTLDFVTEVNTPKNLFVQNFRRILPLTSSTLFKICSKYKDVNAQLCLESIKALRKLLYITLIPYTIHNSKNDHITIPEKIFSDNLNLVDRLRNALTNVMTVGSEISQKSNFESQNTIKNFTSEGKDMVWLQSAFPKISFMLHTFCDSILANENKEKNLSLSNFNLIETQIGEICIQFLPIIYNLKNITSNNQEMCIHESIINRIAENLYSKMFDTILVLLGDFDNIDNPNENMNKKKRILMYLSSQNLLNNSPEIYTRFKEKFEACLSQTHVLLLKLSPQTSKMDNYNHDLSPIKLVLNQLKYANACLIIMSEYEQQNRKNLIAMENVSFTEYEIAQHIDLLSLIICPLLENMIYNLSCNDTRFVAFSIFRPTSNDFPVITEWQDSIFNNKVSASQNLSDLTNFLLIPHSINGVPPNENISLIITQQALKLVQIMVEKLINNYCSNVSFIIDHILENKIHSDNNLQESSNAKLETISYIFIFNSIIKSLTFTDKKSLETAERNEKSSLNEQLVTYFIRNLLPFYLDVKSTFLNSTIQKCSEESLENYNQRTSCENISEKSSAQSLPQTENKIYSIDGKTRIRKRNKAKLEITRFEFEVQASQNLPSQSTPFANNTHILDVESLKLTDTKYSSLIIPGLMHENHRHINNFNPYTEQKNRNKQHNIIQNAIGVNYTLQGISYLLELIALQSVGLKHDASIHKVLLNQILYPLLRNIHNLDNGNSSIQESNFLHGIIDQLCNICGSNINTDQDNKITLGQLVMQNMESFIQDITGEIECWIESDLLNLNILLFPSTLKTAVSRSPFLCEHQNRTQAHNQNNYCHDEKNATNWIEEQSKLLHERFVSAQRTLISFIRYCSQNLMTLTFNNNNFVNDALTMYTRPLLLVTLESGLKKWSYNTLKEQNNENLLGILHIYRAYMAYVKLLTFHHFPGINDQFKALLETAMHFTNTIVNNDNQNINMTFKNETTQAAIQKIITTEKTICDAYKEASNIKHEKDMPLYVSVTRKILQILAPFLYYESLCVKGLILDCIEDGLTALMPYTSTCLPTWYAVWGPLTTNFRLQSFASTPVGANTESNLKNLDNFLIISNSVGDNENRRPALNHNTIKSTMKVAKISKGHSDLITQFTFAHLIFYGRMLKLMYNASIIDTEVCGFIKARAFSQLLKPLLYTYHDHILLAQQPHINRFRLQEYADEPMFSTVYGLYLTYLTHICISFDVPQQHLQYLQQYLQQNTCISNIVRHPKIKQLLASLIGNIEDHIGKLS